MLLCKEFKFSAAHKLENYDGKCENLHGHTWKVKIDIFDNINTKSTSNNGILFDFHNIKDIKNIFDHKYLNDVITINPSAENLASIICVLLFIKFTDHTDISDVTIQVTLWESENAYAQIGINGALSWLGIDDYSIDNVTNKIEELFK